MAGWREGGKVYLGSCRKMSQAEALQKARRDKGEGAGIQQREHCATSARYQDGLRYRGLGLRRS